MATAQSILAVIRAAGPLLNTAQDRVAFAVRAAFFALGHLLIAFGSAALAEDAFSTTSDDEVRMNSSWNVMEDVYAFIYSKPDRLGPNKVRVKCHRAQAGKMVVEVMKESARSPLRLELTIEEFAHDCGGRPNYFVQYKNLQRFAEILNREIFDKLYDSNARSRSSSPEADPRAYLPSRTGEGACDDVHLRNPTMSFPPHRSDQVPPPIRHSSGGNWKFVFRGRHALHRSDRRDDGGAAGSNVRG